MRNLRKNLLIFMILFAQALVMSLGSVSLATVSHDTQSKKDEAGDWDASGGELKIPNVTPDMILENRVFIHKVLKNIFYTMERYDFLYDIRNPSGEFWDIVENDDILNKVEKTNFLKSKQALLAAYDKLFSKQDERQNIYQVLDLDSAKIKLEFKENCKVHSGSEKDGSTGDIIGDGIICLSNKRLKEKLSYLDVTPAMASLIVHEYTHEVGGSEQEANAAAFLAMFIVHRSDTEGFLKNWPYKDNYKEIEKLVSEIQTQLENSKFYSDLSPEEFQFDEVMAKKLHRDELLKQKSILKDKLADRSTVQQADYEKLREIEVSLTQINNFLNGAFLDGVVTIKDKNKICQNLKRLHDFVRRFGHKGQGDVLAYFDVHDYKYRTSMFSYMKYDLDFCKEYGRKMYERPFNGKDYADIEDLSKMGDGYDVDSMNRILPLDYKVFRVEPGNGIQLKRQMNQFQVYFAKLQQALNNEMQRMQLIEKLYE